MVIIIRLGDSPAIKALRDDSIGDPQPEQLGVLEMAQAVRTKLQFSIFIALSVSFEQGQFRIAG